MTPAHFSAIRHALGWTLRHIARELECDPNIPARWDDGRAAIPPQIEKWMERWARVRERLPPPDDWRVR